MLENKAILVVEDEPLIAAMLEDMLTDLGCSVVGPATNLAEAQSLLDAGTYDAAIIDLNLNGVRSDGVIASLRLKGTPVIIATGYGYQTSSLPEGCRVLAKPYASQHVEQVLRDCLAKGSEAA